MQQECSSNNLKMKIDLNFDSSKLIDENILLLKSYGFLFFEYRVIKVVYRYIIDWVGGSS